MFFSEDLHVMVPSPPACFQVLKLSLDLNNRHKIGDSSNPDNCNGQVKLNIPITCKHKGCPAKTPTSARYSDHSSILIISAEVQSQPRPAIAFVFLL